MDAEAAFALMKNLRAKLSKLPGTGLADLIISEADDFSYTDSVDGSTSDEQGIRIIFESGARAVLRLSGTGTEGATLRIYLESFEPNPTCQSLETQEMLAPLAAVVDGLAEVLKRTNRAEPDLMT